MVGSKRKDPTGIMDANVFQWNCDFPKDYTPCHNISPAELLNFYGQSVVTDGSDM